MERLPEMIDAFNGHLADALRCVMQLDLHGAEIALANAQLMAEFISGAAEAAKQ